MFWDIWVDPNKIYITDILSPSQILHESMQLFTTVSYQLGEPGTILISAVAWSSCTLNINTYDSFSRTAE